MPHDIVNGHVGHGRRRGHGHGDGPGQDDGQDHGHGQVSGDGQHHGHGHNHGPEHLASHMGAADAADDLRTLTAQFIDGFVQAADKTAFLRLAGVPFEKGALKLVDVRLVREWQMGTASPAFGSRELSYLPFPGEMVSGRENMELVYVSADRLERVDIREVLRDRAG